MSGVKKETGNEQMTHAFLVNMASQWLQKKNCVVITELVTYAGEQPDAMGFGYGGASTIVECKVSRNDFKADQKKMHRQNNFFGMGDYCWYLVPHGLITAEEIPTDWGLLYIKDGKIRKIKDAIKKENKNAKHEIIFLVSAIRRIGMLVPMEDVTMAISYYLYEPHQKLKASIGIEKFESENAQ